VDFFKDLEIIRQPCYGTFVGFGTTVLLRLDKLKDDLTVTMIDLVSTVAGSKSRTLSHCICTWLFGVGLIVKWENCVGIVG
jgi:hypothetical protein